MLFAKIHVKKYSRHAIEKEKKIHYKHLRMFKKIYKIALKSTIKM